MKKKGLYIVLGIVALVLIGYFNSDEYQKNKERYSTPSQEKQMPEEAEKSKSKNTSGVVTIDGNGNEVETKEVEKEEPKMKMDNSAFWNEFDPIVKERIHKLIENKDCAGLQQEFNNTADNMDRIQNAGGSGSRNLKLLTFLEDKMKELDCY
ncbi:MAG: hypothetical protein KDC90_03390 [Ignavibacteriae bacterium]|nr:hypothetical protein [Ignavibacteriota bacterium]